MEDLTKLCTVKVVSKYVVSVSSGYFFEFSTLWWLVFQILKVRLIKICKIETPDLLFLVAFISFYISRYHFSQIFCNSFLIIRKKNFRHRFSFLTDLPTQNPPSPSPHALNSQNPLSVTKVFCRCSLIWCKQKQMVLCS